jgi:hypothetical protein
VSTDKIRYRFSGHESFPLRYAWLPKAYELLDKSATGFQDLEQAMITLGLGKNMLKSLRFWVEVVGLATPKDRGTRLELTEFARLIFDKKGFDPFLEDDQTLWLIHWQLSSHTHKPLFAWDFLLNRWPHAEISREPVLLAFAKQAEETNGRLHARTLRNHLDIFLRTYIAGKPGKRDCQEDNLDSPLVQLRLLERVGERVSRESGRREPVYAFRREPKPEISSRLFAYAVQDFWSKRHPNEGTLSLDQLLYGHGSPGQVFKLPDWAIRERLAKLGEASQGEFEYQESAALQQLRRRQDSNTSLFAAEMLGALYGQEPTCV